MQINFSLPKFLAALRVVSFEFLASFSFVLIYSMAMVVSNVSPTQPQPLNSIAVTLSPIFLGLAFAAVWSLFNRYGNTYINPVLSTVALMQRKIKVVEWLLAVPSQIVGAFLAPMLVMVLYANESIGFIGYEYITTVLESQELNMNIIPLFEVIGGMVLAWSILHMADKPNREKYMNVGVALAIVTLIAQPIVMGFFNPALAIALRMPAVYWFAPLLGGLLAVLVHIGLSKLVRK